MMKSVTVTFLVALTIGFLAGRIVDIPTDEIHQAITPPSHCITEESLSNTKDPIHNTTSNEACLCDVSALCSQAEYDNTLSDQTNINSQNTTSQADNSFSELLRQLLEKRKYNEAIGLYQNVIDYSPEFSKSLRHSLVTHMKKLSNTGDSQGFSELSDIYLADFYDDIEVLLTVAIHYARNALFYDGINHLQLAANYAISGHDKSLFNQQYELYISIMENAHTNNEDWLGLLNLYESANTAGLLTHQDRYRTVELYLKLEDIRQAAVAAEPLLANNEWRDKVYQLLSSNNVTSPTEQNQGRSYDSKIPLLARANQFIVPVEISRSPAKLLLDTGASMTVLTQNYYNQVSSQLSLTYKASQSFRTANGIVNANIYTADVFLIGEFEIKNLDIAILDYPSSPESHGLLGMNVLSLFRFEIDQQNAELMLNKKAAH